MEKKAKPVVKTPKQIKRCRYCGSIHPFRQCSAYGKAHKDCQKRIHIKAVGRSNNGRRGAVYR